MLILAAFAFSPLLVSQAEAGQGKQVNAKHHHKHHKKHHHKKHHKKS
jgi:hypothetical protein